MDRRVRADRGAPPGHFGTRDRRERHAHRRLPGRGGEFVGKNFANHALTRETLRNDEGATTVAGFDGVRRNLGYVRVPGTRARLAVGLDESVVHSGIDREISIAYVQLALFGMRSAHRLVRRRAAHRAPDPRAGTYGGALRAGDLHVRAGDEPWLAEFQPLAAALDDMAHKLAGREEELRVANQHLEALASLDGLTGVSNRRGFDRALERAWQHAGERREPLALMMIDIDHFKLFNDRYGHVSGDTCLRAVGETLSLVLLDEAVLVARYGGEEFAPPLPGLDISRATALADEARGAIEDLLITHADSPCARHRQRRRRIDRAGARPSGRRSGRGGGSRALRGEAARPQHGDRARSDGDERGMMMKAPTRPTPRLG